MSNALTIEGATQKHAGGRPSKYDPVFCDKVRELGSLGNSKFQIARDLGVTLQTMINWQKAHPEFLEAVKEAEQLSLAWWEDTGRTGMYMGGKDFNATMYIFQMKARFRHVYGDTVKDEDTGANLVGETLSELEIARRIAFALGRVVGRTEEQVKAKATLPNESAG